MRIDSQMVIDGCEEIPWAADSFDRIFSALVGGSDASSCLNASTCPDIRECSRPVISAWLLSSRWCAGVSGTGAGCVVDFGRAPELTGDNHQYAFIQATFVDILDQAETA